MANHIEISALHSSGPDAWNAIKKLELSLLLIRLTTAAFVLVWAVAKFANVKQQQGVASTFYGWKDASPDIWMLIGDVQVVILLAFASGFWKTWTYGGVFVMHAASVIVRG